MFWLITGCVLLLLYTFFRKHENNFRTAIATQLAFIAYACSSLVSHAIAYTMAIVSASAGFFVVAWVIFKILT